jgi:hypothetical protein
MNRPHPFDFINVANDRRSKIFFHPFYNFNANELKLYLIRCDILQKELVVF